MAALLRTADFSRAANTFRTRVGGVVSIVSGGENPRIDGALVWVGDVWRRETSCPEGFGNCVLDLGIWSATVAARRSA
jgi:hypothetical protein